MGLFMQRPEEPTEWAGLPSEPLRPKSGAELLSDDGQPAVGSADLVDPGAVTSIEIVIPPLEDGDAADA